MIGRSITNLFLFLIALSLPVSSLSADMPRLPESIGSDPVLGIVEGIKTWNPEDMFEHVNGEAELLIRYGAVNLIFVAYENAGGNYLSVDILDMEKPINAYGLYRLYAGCDGKEYNLAGATVLEDEYAPHAKLGRYFVRFNIDVGDHKDGGKALVDEFLVSFSNELPEQEPLPAVLESLKQKARYPCEVNYHPEHMDYDLESGPGYSWIGPDGESYFINLLSTADEAELHAQSMRNRGVPTIVVWKNAVIWQKVSRDNSQQYILSILQEITD